MSSSKRPSLVCARGAWPGTRWTEDAEDLWLRDLISYSAEEALGAVEQCRRTLDRQPSWHQFLEAVTLVRKDLARRASERGLGAAKEPAPESVRKRLAATVRGLKSAVSRVEHDHKPRKVALRHEGSQEPVRDENGDYVYEIVSGAAACPTCSQHDHSNRNLAGIDNGVPVPMWELTCPRCGDPHRPLSNWTPEALAYLREITTAF